MNLENWFTYISNPAWLLASYTETSLRCSLPVPARLYGRANVAFKTPA